MEDSTARKIAISALVAIVISDLAILGSIRSIDSCVDDARERAHAAQLRFKEVMTAVRDNAQDIKALVDSLEKISDDVDANEAQLERIAEEAMK